MLVTLKFSKDGDHICATLSDFKDLQSSPAGFRNDREEALTELCLDLKKELEKQKANKNLNLVDLEKGKGSEVQRALEELKILLAACNDNLKPLEEVSGKILNNGAREAIVKCLELIDCLTVKAQTLVTALEDEKKPEPKIDMKEEYAEPVSIWKDVSELPKNKSNLFIRRKDGDFVPSRYDEQAILRFSGNCVEDIISWCYLTDFVNSFEQMQNDITELKKGFKSAALQESQKQN